MNRLLAGDTRACDSGIILLRCQFFLVELVYVGLTIRDQKSAIKSTLDQIGKRITTARLVEL